MHVHDTLLMVGNTGKDGLSVGFVEQNRRLFETYDASLHFESTYREDKCAFQGRDGRE